MHSEIPEQSVRGSALAGTFTNGFALSTAVSAALLLGAAPRQAIANAVQPAAAQRSDTIVIRAAAPVHPGIAIIQEVLSIGKDDSSEEYMIAALADLAFGPDGSIFVADRGATGNTLGALASIRQYDSTGKFIRRIGRGGQGPGEFRAFSGMRTLADGRLVLYDGSAGRVNIWARNGEFQTSWPAPTGIGSTGFFLNPNGDSYIRISRIASGAVQSSAFVHFNIRGQVLDTVHEPPRPDMPTNRLTATQGTRTVQAGVPFMPRFTHWFSPLGYFVAARTDRYALLLYQRVRSGQSGTPWRPGSPITSIQKSEAQVPVTAEEQGLWRSSIETRMRETQPGWTWNGPEIPRVKPYFLNLMTDLDARIWARVMDPAEKITPDTDMDDSAANFWDVFEPGGRYLGRVRTGPGILPTHVKGDRVLTYARDADDVQRVVVARIQWGR